MAKLLSFDGKQKRVLQSKGREKKQNKKNDNSEYC